MLWLKLSEKELLPNPSSSSPLTTVNSTKNLPIVTIKECDAPTDHIHSPEANVRTNLLKDLGIENFAKIA